MSNKIHRRDDVNIDDVNIEEGVKECGGVEFADTTNHKYPIDTPEHVRAAWSYINQHDNSATYETSEVKVIKDRIRNAAEKHGVEIETG